MSEESYGDQDAALDATFALFITFMLGIIFAGAMALLYFKAERMAHDRARPADSKNLGENFPSRLPTIGGTARE